MANPSPFAVNTQPLQSWMGAAAPGATPAPPPPGPNATNFNPFGFLPNAQNATPKPSPNVGTMERPGAYENYWQSVAPQFQQPGATEQALGSTQQGYRDLMGQSGPTYAAGAYGDFQNSPQTANLDPYYDRAWEEGSNRLDNVFASRGGYNSSEAVRQQSDLAGQLGASKARDSADYALRRAQTGGNLASVASNEASGNLGRQESLLGSIFGAGQQADNEKLARLGMGMEGANMAQNAFENRNQQGLDNISNYSGGLADVFSQGSQAAIAADMEAQGVPHELAMAMARLQMDSFGQQSNNLLGAGGAVLNFLKK